MITKVEMLLFVLKVAHERDNGFWFESADTESFNGWILAWMGV